MTYIDDFRLWATRRKLRLEESAARWLEARRAKRAARIAYDNEVIGCGLTRKDIRELAEAVTYDIYGPL